LLTLLATPIARTWELTVWLATTFRVVPGVKIKTNALIKTALDATLSATHVPIVQAMNFVVHVSMKPDVFGVKTPTLHQDANLMLLLNVPKRLPLALLSVSNSEAANYVTNSRDVPGVITILATALICKELAVSSLTDALPLLLTSLLIASLLTEAPLLVVCSW